MKPTSSSDYQRELRVTYECNKEYDGKECRGLIMETSKKPQDIVSGWLGLVMTAPLNSGACKKCGYSTFSDCNSAGSIHIYDGKKEIQFDDVKSILSKPIKEENNG